jgi:DNA-directed RNA polymerase subunit L
MSASINNNMYTPVVSNKNIVDDISTFTLSEVDVSIANAIRRTILSDINIVVFRTTPNEENRANITSNTTRLNNEILKQRLSCIPIYIKDLGEEALANYIVEVNEENLTDTIMLITTKHFKIKDKTTNKYLPESEVQRIFPPFVGENGVNYFIEFVRLRPRISDEIPGEKIQFTCEFSIGCARENSMFNVVGTCAYGFTVDENAAQENLLIKQEKWKGDGMDAATIEYESKNWGLLEAKRFTIKNSFEFQLASCCVFDTNELVYIACQELINKFDLLILDINQNRMEVRENTTSTLNTFDFILENEDYTIGNIINHLLYKNHYEGSRTISYCGFKKLHPHDYDSIIRVTYIDSTTPELGFQQIKECCEESIEIFRKIMMYFKGEVDIPHYNNIVLKQETPEQAKPQPPLNESKEQELEEEPM